MNKSDPGFLPSELTRKLRSFADDRMRRSVLRDAVSRMCDDDILALVSYLICITDTDDARRVYLDLVRLLLASAPWSSERMSLVENYPAIKGRRPVLEFLGMDDSRSRRGGGTFGPWAMEDIPLGVRKSRARTRDEDTLLMLTLDPEPSVISILLDNPRVTETIALRVASRRPQKATIFPVILESRFITSETMQNSIVNNPYCPTRLSVALVPLLSRTHRLDIAESGSVDEPVRLAAISMNEHT